MSIVINQAKKSEIEAKRNGGANGEADKLKRTAKKAELAALLKSLKSPEAEAIRKIIEML